MNHMSVQRQTFTERSVCSLSLLGCATRINPGSSLIYNIENITLAITDCNHLFLTVLLSFYTQRGDMFTVLINDSDEELT